MHIVLKFSSWSDAKGNRSMILEDVLRLIGGGSDSPNSDYMPIACLLNSGYGCVGYFNSSVNESLSDTIVLLNMRLVDLRVEEGHSRRGRVADFNDFLQSWHNTFRRNQATKSQKNREARVAQFR
jgi:hypothetical protein